MTDDSQPDGTAGPRQVDGKLTYFPADRRGRSKGGWLDSRHSFSFAGYHDPHRMGIGPLRVLNDDRVAPGQGFGAHSHRDMEIVSYVLSGSLAHQDSHGHRGIIQAGQAQFMRAGSGVTHSEMNASQTEPVHFLQIWLRPRTLGSPPAYGELDVDVSKPGAWFTIASGHDEGLQIDQDASLRTARFEKGQQLSLPGQGGRAYYAFVIEGAVTTHGHTLRTGDAMLIVEDACEVAAAEASHVLMFDLPLARGRPTGNPCG